MSSPPRPDGQVLRLWAHGDLPAAAALARAAGFDRFRALWQMRRSLREPLDQPVLPAGRTLRTFVPGQDEDEWLNLNGRAFAKHPEQGGWTRHDLELRERGAVVRPGGLLHRGNETASMAGFHWTKVHAGQRSRPDAWGEVYVVGVDPAEQGSGLGRALTLAGLRHLRDLGVAQAMLYVDEDNAPAIRMYEALGFTRATVDAMYRELPAQAGETARKDHDSPELAAVDAQRLVKFRGRQRPVRGRHRAQHLGVELYLIKGDAIVDTKIQLPGNRAHLRR